MLVRAVIAVVITLAMGGAGSIGYAQVQSPGPGAVAVPPKPYNQDDVVQMAEWDFIYGSEKDWEEGIAYLRQMREEQLDQYKEQWRDEKWRDYVCGTLYRALERAFAAKHYELCDRAASHGAVIAASQLPWVEKFLEMQIQAKLKLGNAREALPLAKSYYNVCSMSRTSSAIDLVVLCLVGDSLTPEASAMVRRFRMQQVEGATLPPASDMATAIVQADSVLASIKVDGIVYQKAAEPLESRGETYVRLVERGNLLLMADQPAAAKPLFTKAYAIAGGKEVAEATEGIARAMRAEDGTVGRANAWVLSLRPPTEEK